MTAVSIPPLILTPGDPAGIGREIALKAWARRTAEKLPPFLLMEDPVSLQAQITSWGLDIPLAIMDRPGQAHEKFDDALPILPISFPAPVIAGKPDKRNAAAVIAAIESAVTYVRSGQAAALVTNPVHKGILYEAGFTHPGHTEFLQSLTDSSRAVMMLAAPGLRVVPLTIHQALRGVPHAITADLIKETVIILADALRRDFACIKPRIAIAGLNPHAGEGGAFGDEEIKIIAPTVEALRGLGFDLMGPLSADTLFHEAARARYDAAICMYHDQALIPIKTLAFDRAVNVTLGLPIIRTSPDHGTAFDIAGQNRASATSLIEALRLGDMMARNRAQAPP